MGFLDDVQRGVSNVANDAVQRNRSLTGMIRIHF